MRSRWRDNALPVESPAPPEPLPGGSLYLVTRMETRTTRFIVLANSAAAAAEGGGDARFIAPLSDDVEKDVLPPVELREIVGDDA